MTATGGPERAALPPGAEAVLVSAGGLAVAVVLWQLWGRYLPAPNGRIGVDYGLFLPLLLNGFYWFQANGPLAVPWFSPAFCGGLPLYPDPQSVYYSLPQALTLVTGPLAAVRATFFVFAFVGFAGTYALLRRGFGLGIAVAALGAVVFAFNSAYGARMVIGHLPYHAFQLTPLIAYCLLRPEPEKGKRLHVAAGALCAGLLFTYTVQAGAVHLIVPMALAVAAIGLAHALRGGSAKALAAGFAGAVAVALVTSAAKVWAALSYLSAAPRAGYPLPGAENVGDLAAMALRLLFDGPAEGLYERTFTNVRWALERYEFETAVTFVPAVILVLAAGAGLCRWLRRRQRPARRSLALAAAMAGLLAVPLAVNVYTPEWNAVLKATPVIKNSSTLVRWFMAYVPIIAVASALALAGLARRGPLGPGAAPNAAAMLGVALVVAVNLGTDRSFYAAQRYDPATIRAAYARAVTEGRAYPVSEAVFHVDRRGRIRLPIGRNDALAEGRTALLCLAPIFGYRLEWLPRGIVPGPTFREREGGLNLFDPACFVFPEANSCRPGDRFATDRKEAAGAFVQYRPFDFRFSAAQKIANGINLLGLVAALAFLGYLGAAAIRRRGGG